MLCSVVKGSENNTLQLNKKLTLNVLVNSSNTNSQFGGNTSGMDSSDFRLLEDDCDTILLLDGTSMLAKIKAIRLEGFLYTTCPIGAKEQYIANKLIHEIHFAKGTIRKINKSSSEKAIEAASREKESKVRMTNREKESKVLKATSDSNCYSNNVNIEFLGKGATGGIISYERKLNDRTAIGAGLGIQDFYFYDKSIYIEYVLSIPIYGVTYLGKKAEYQSHKRNTWIIKYGILHNETFRDYKDGRKDEFLKYADNTPFVSAGLEHSPRRNIFRAEMYAFYTGPDAWLFPWVAPWIGFSYGRKF
jgi:hypothetical protein